MDNIRSKILNGTASDPEKQDFYASLQADPQKKKDFIDLKRLYSIDKAFLQTTTFTHKKERFQVFWKQTRREKWQTWPMKLVGYAAIFIVALTVSQVIDTWKGNDDAQNAHSITQVQAQSGSINTFQFADGSKVWLNTQSEITLLSETSNQIELKLEGEALFEVKHNEKRSFIVEAGGIKVIDKGTTFNIRSYPLDEEVVTTLIEGKAEVVSPEGKILTHLTPGDHFSYQRETGQFKVDSIDTSFISGWKDGKFVFIDKTLGEIAGELEKWYDVDIQFENPDLAKERFTGVINHTSNIGKVLQMLSYSADIAYKIDEKENGKQTVLIK